MKNELLIKKCEECGALVKVLADCTCENCGIKCCGENMKVVTANSTDASAEKHVPTYEIIDDEMKISIHNQQIIAFFLFFTDCSQNGRKQGCPPLTRLKRPCAPNGKKIINC